MGGTERAAEVAPPLVPIQSGLVRPLRGPHQEAHGRKAQSPSRFPSDGFGMIEPPLRDVAAPCRDPGDDPRRQPPRPDRTGDRMSEWPGGAPSPAQLERED